MYTQTFTFLLASGALLSLSRLLLAAWQWPRARGQLWPILFGGWRIDAHVLGMVVALPLLLAPWVGHLPWAVAADAVWLQCGWLLLVWLELSTPQFMIEYGTRPNRLYLDYLRYPREVLTMLWRGYRAVIFLACGGLALAAVLGWAWFGGAWAQRELDSVFARLGLSLLAAAVCFLAIRGTLRHRPINPSTVAFSSDPMLNALALNSLYSVAYAAYSLKNEREVSGRYGQLPDDAVQAEVARVAGLAPPAPDAALPTLHRQVPARPRARPPHIVMIVEESLGAQFTGHLGGAGLTPALDALADQGWCFSSAYATGTRSVRGLEALVTGFPPSVSDSVLRLPNAQDRFFTLAHLLRQHGYTSRFVYGGEAHFDNMQGFFLGNGFDEVHDRATFARPAFVGTWGACDEDMFGRVHELLQAGGEGPTFTLAFSVSNHTPWEYPSGRIEPEGEPASMANAVRYADWALGQFFSRARASDYWDDTLFLVVADHDARVGGREQIPLRHFHIPALILGGGVAPRRDDRLISQIDLPVTLLSLAGIEGEHPMIGHDLNLAGAGGRAMMQYGDDYGYLRGDRLAVLAPQQAPAQFRHVRGPGWDASEQLLAVAEPDPALTREALAHLLWADTSYRRRRYTLPHLWQGRTPGPASGEAPSAP